MKILSIKVNDRRRDSMLFMYGIDDNILNSGLIFFKVYG